MLHFRLFRLVPLLFTATLLAILAPQAPAQAQASQRCFTETKLCIDGRVREFWEQNGGLPVFGLPVTALQTETIEGKRLQVQWFERNRLELHPENQRPYDVLLGRLGADRLAQQGRDPFTFPKNDRPQNGCRFFAETNHSVCGDILQAWRASGLEIDGKRGKSEAENLALFGLPLSDPAIETLNGQQYTVQWFERARFELHPENAAPYTVLLGLLGNEIRAGGAPAPAPADACADVAEPVSATLVETSKCVKPGDSLKMLLSGFQADERIAFWINLPDGSIFGTPN